MRITRNVQNLWLTPSIMFSDNSKRFFRIACINALNNKWSYTIQDCMVNSAGLRFLSGVPATETKTWKITKTREHFHFTCNGIVLLNFNFQYDYEAGYQNCRSIWGSDFTGIIFDYGGEMYNGYLSMRFGMISGETKFKCKILVFNWSSISHAIFSKFLEAPYSHFHTIIHCKPETRKVILYVCSCVLPLKFVQLQKLYRILPLKLYSCSDCRFKINYIIENSVK